MEEESENTPALKAQQEKYESILALRNEEVSEFVDKVVKENCALKRQIVLNEIDIAKGEEMLGNMSIKYYNLDTGNATETERNFYEIMHDIKEENDLKLREINEKYNKANEALYKEHLGIVYNLKKLSKKAKEFNKVNDKEIEAAFVTEDIPIYTLVNIKDKVDSYETKLKTANEELYNSQKYSQLIQQKYETLLQENKMIKARINDEKNNILFTIDQLSQKDCEMINKITNEYKTQSDLITQTFMSFNHNESNKEQLLLKSLFAEKDELSTKAIVTSNKYDKLKAEYDQLSSSYKKIENALSENELEIRQLRLFKEENEKHQRKYEDDIKRISIEAINSRQTISELTTKVTSYENKISLLNTSLESEVIKISNKYKEMIDNLNKNLLQLEKEKREIANTYEKNNKNGIRYDEKIKELTTLNDALTSVNQSLQNKVTETDKKNELLLKQYNELDERHRNLYDKCRIIDEQLTLNDDQVTSNKKKFADNEVEIMNLKEELGKVEQERDEMQKTNELLKRENNAITQKLDGVRVNSTMELTKMKNQLVDIEKKSNPKSPLNTNQNINQSDYNQIKKSIARVYQIYKDKLKPDTSYGSIDELKMIIEIEQNLEKCLKNNGNNSTTTKGDNDIGKLAEQLAKKEEELASYKSKLNTVFQITNSAKSHKNSLKSNHNTFIKNLEENDQLNQFYESLIIHIQNANLLHMFQLFKINLDREEEFFKMLNNKNMVNNVPLNKLSELQNQLDVVKKNSAETMKELNRRSMNYVSLDDFRQLFEHYRASIDKAVQSIFKAFLDHRVDKNTNIICIQYPSMEFNNMVDTMSNYYKGELGKWNVIVEKYKSQAENVTKAIDVISKLTYTDNEILSSLLKEKVI